MRHRTLCVARRRNKEARKKLLGTRPSSTAFFADVEISTGYGPAAIDPPRGF
jgi:hypothetical protein